MKHKIDASKKTAQHFSSNHVNNIEGYPIYPVDEDIYVQAIEENEIDPEEISKYKQPNNTIGKNNEKAFKDDFSGSDLDIPGSELDDIQEDIGSEDEENNYYSLGDDDNNYLSEDED